MCQLQNVQVCEKLECLILILSSPSILSLKEEILVDRNFCVFAVFDSFCEILCPRHFSNLVIRGS